MSEKKGFFQRLRQRLNQGDSFLTRDLSELLPAGGKPDESTLEELETRLLMADVGVDATQAIMDTLYQQLDRKALADSQQLMAGLEAGIRGILDPVEQALRAGKDR
jgi:fused signal recognition particle receptor